MIRTILVPTDFSKESSAALQYARGLADALRASLRILHVVEIPYVYPAYSEMYIPPPAAYLDQMEQDARERLNGLLSAGEKEMYRAHAVLKNGRPAEEILNYLEDERDVDLVVMGTHGRGGVARLMMGSVADKVVRSSPCPVLMVRDPARSRPGGKEQAA